MSNINNTKYNFTLTSELQLNEAAAAVNNESVGYPITEVCSIGCSWNCSNETAENVTLTTEEQLNEAAALTDTDSVGYPITEFCSIGCSWSCN